MVATMGILAVSCTSTDPLNAPSTATSPGMMTTSTSGGPHDEAATMLPDLLRLEPVPVTAGEMVKMLFPDETLRGVYFVLELQQEDSWTLRYNLISDFGGSSQPQAYSYEEKEIFNFPDIGIGGPGPDSVLIPNETPPGDYRICTGNAGDNFCATIRLKPGEIADDYTYGYRQMK